MEDLVVSMDKFWQNKKVFLTGHTGFKGSWLALWLQQMGAEVYGFSLEPTTKQNLYELAHIDSILTSKFGDVRDFHSLKKSIESFQPEFIFHLAAQPLVRQSYSDPLETYSTNVMGTVNLLEIARCVASVKVIVNVTTDKCYQNREWLWGYRENEPMGGHDPYSASKGCAELVTNSYIKSFFDNSGVGLASARAGNVIGGGDWSDDRLLPDILKSLTNGEVARIRNPNATRPWQHVLEPLCGYLQLAMKLYQQPHKHSGGWNFGPLDSDCRAVGWIADKVCSNWGKGASWISNEGNGPHEARYLKLDISKATSLLNWSPRWSIDTAISATIDWHKRYLGGDDPQFAMSEQIKDYCTDG